MAQVFILWSAGCLICILTSLAHGQMCDPGWISKAASVDGYQAIRGTSYCEGFIKEPNSLSEVQLVYFERIGVVTTSTQWLHIELATKETSTVNVRGISAVLGLAYRFNAAVGSGQHVDIDVDRVIRKHNVPVNSVSFVGTSTASTAITPVIVRDRDGPPQYGKPVVGLRLPSSTTKVQYRFDDGTNTAPWKDYAQGQTDFGISKFVVENVDKDVITLQVIATLNGGGEARYSQEIKVK